MNRGPENVTFAHQVYADQGGLEALGRAENPLQEAYRCALPALCFKGVVDRRQQKLSSERETPCTFCSLEIITIYVAIHRLRRQRPVKNVVLCTAGPYGLSQELSLAVVTACELKPWPDPNSLLRVQLGAL